MTPSIGRPRFVPELPLPPYSYVPGGRFPHPRSHPQGHSFGTVQGQAQAPDPNRWQSSRCYLHGLDLFNHGYYWEAHEVWEQLWHACGRTGATADFLKALIKMAAAGVKVREGVPEGARNHARRARELVARAARTLDPAERRYMGLDLEQLLAFASSVSMEPPQDVSCGPGAVIPVFASVLQPS